MSSDSNDLNKSKIVKELVNPNIVSNGLIMLKLRKDDGKYGLNPIIHHLITIA